MSLESPTHLAELLRQKVGCVGDFWQWVPLWLVGIHKP